MSYGNLVAEAILSTDPAAKADALRQMTCKGLASTQMTCHCGDILDQSTVCVLERCWHDKTLPDDTIVVCCPKCRQIAEKHVRKYTSRRAGKAVYKWLTWDAEFVIDSGESLPETRELPGLEIQKRGKKEWRIVHLVSDQFLSRHTTRRSARQLLAQLQELKIDWNLDARTIKKMVPRAKAQEISTLVCFYGDLK